jgi:hypothetical protein
MADSECSPSDGCTVGADGARHCSPRPLCK